MSLIEKLRPRQWYQAQNRIFMPLGKSRDTSLYNNFGQHPEYIVHIVYLQPVEHMRVFSFYLDNWGLFLEKNREYLYHIGSEDVIEENDIESPKQSTFNAVFKAFFEYRWQIGPSTKFTNVEDKKAVAELSELISAVRGGS